MDATVSRAPCSTGSGSASGFQACRCDPVEVNGGPGALLLDGNQRLIGVMVLRIAGGQIQSISSIVNPDKLMHIGPVGDIASLLRS